MNRAAALAAVVVMGTAPLARADTEWYGWQPLAADFGSITLGALASKTDGKTSGALVYTALTTYAVAGPIIHAAHGDWGRAGLDLGLRLTLPPLGYLVVSSTSSCHGGWCGLGDLIFGGGGGMLVAAALDWTVLSIKDTSTDPAARRRVLFSFGARF